MPRAKKSQTVEVLHEIEKDPIQILTEAVINLTAVTERIERKLKEITGD